MMKNVQIKVIKKSGTIKQITLQDKKLSYALKKSRRARRLRLAVHCDGSVVLTMPHYLEESVAEKFIRDKTKWLFSKIKFFRRFAGQPAPRRGRRDYLKHKDAALAMAKERVFHFNELCGYKINKINIKNQKTRWGSCSRNGNLNFNYKILFLPEIQRDYVIAHELCHLKELNHSGRFWKLLAQTFPNLAEAKKGLKNSALNLR